MRTRLVMVVACAALCAAASWAVPGGSAGAAPAPDPIWVRQLGVTGEQAGSAIAVDGDGNVYLAGGSDGNLPGSDGAGGAFVARYTAAGQQVWLHPFGVGASVSSMTLGPTGAVVVAGFTIQPLPGSPDPPAGGRDAFVAQFGPDGSPEWARQLGGPADDYAVSVASNASGAITVGGYGYGPIAGAPETFGGAVDVFFARFDTTGARAWVHQFGRAGTELGGYVAVAPDGSTYLAGSTFERLPGEHERHSGGLNTFIAKFSSAGRRLWVHELGGRLREFASGIVLDHAGNVYMTGATNEVLPGSTDAYSGGLDDAFVVKFDSDGGPLWVRELGSSRFDWPNGIALDGAGNSYIAGRTTGTVSGSPRAKVGAEDFFVASFDPAGTPRWAEELGTTRRDNALAIAAPGGLLGVFVTGQTGGRLPYSHATKPQYTAIFIARYRSIG